MVEHFANNDDEYLAWLKDHGDDGYVLSGSQAASVVVSQTALGKGYSHAISLSVAASVTFSRTSEREQQNP